MKRDTRATREVHPRPGGKLPGNTAYRGWYSHLTDTWESIRGPDPRPPAARRGRRRDGRLRRRPGRRRGVLRGRPRPAGGRPGAGPARLLPGRGGEPVAGVRPGDDAPGRGA